MSARPARPPRPVRAALVLAVLVAGLLPAAVDAATVTVHIGQGLSPRTLTIAPGTTVRWVNESDNRYRMRSRNGPEEFDSGNIEPGESYSFTFRLAGTYPYLDDRDRDDPNFHGTITVSATPPAATATPAPDGSPPAGGGGGDGGGSSAATSGTVHMAGRAFSPGTVTIAAGGSVTFVNDDDREHTATGDVFDTGILNPGARSTERFPSAGTFTFLCQIHPDMRGTVTVRSASGAAPPPPAATPGPTPSPTPAPGTATASTGSVTIVDFAFDPAQLAVPAGATVTWTNQGVAPHTVTADDGSFESGRIAPGGTFSQRFDAPGRFTYVCAFHPGMAAAIVVTEAEGSASPSASSSPELSTEPSASASPSASPGGGGNVAAAPPANGAPEADARPVTTQLADGFLRLLLVAIIVAGAVVAFGVLVVNSARPVHRRGAR